MCETLNRVWQIKISNSLQIIVGHNVIISILMWYIVGRVMGMKSKPDLCLWSQIRTCIVHLKNYIYIICCFNSIYSLSVNKAKESHECITHKALNECVSRESVDCSITIFIRGDSAYMYINQVETRFRGNLIVWSHSNPETSDKWFIRHENCKNSFWILPVISIYNCTQWPQNVWNRLTTINWMGCM